MTVVAEFTDRHGRNVAIDKLDGSNRQPPYTYCVTVDNKMTQKDISPEAVIRWLGNASHCEPVTDHPLYRSANHIRYLDFQFEPGHDSVTLASTKSIHGADNREPHKMFLHQHIGIGDESPSALAAINGDCRELARLLNKFDISSEYLSHKTQQCCLSERYVKTIDPSKGVYPTPVFGSDKTQVNGVPVGADEKYKTKGGYQPFTKESKVPTGSDDYFLVRPAYPHPRTGGAHTPSVVQLIDGQLYTPQNEIEPITWSKNGELIQGPTNDPYEAKLEWMPLPE